VPEPYTPLRWELLRHVGPLLLLWLCSLTVAWGLARWLRPRRPRLQRLLIADAGTVELEFAMAFPWFLMVVMIVVQLSFMLHANLVVDYAAYCAARSATVMIAGGADGELKYQGKGEYPLRKEPPNQVCAKGESEKWKRIHGAAWMACLPISPRVSSILRTVRGDTGDPVAAIIREALGIDPGGMLGGLQEVVRLLKGTGSATDPGVRQLLADYADKFPYAFLFTRVFIETSPGKWFSPKVPGHGECEAWQAFPDTPDVLPLKVRVEHDLFMDVPYAGPLYARSLGGGPLLGVVGRLFGLYYMTVSSEYTMQSWTRHEAR
jgi:hypothetical protein